MEETYELIRLNGRVTYDFISEYKEEIQKNIADAPGYIMDLSGVEQIDSTGMGLIINTAKLFINNKNKMVLVNNDPFIKELFEISNLHKVFNICPSVTEAIKVLSVDDDEYWSKVATY